VALSVAGVPVRLNLVIDIVGMAFVIVGGWICVIVRTTLSAPGLNCAGQVTSNSVANQCNRSWNAKVQKTRIFSVISLSLNKRRRPTLVHNKVQVTEEEGVLWFNCGGK